MSSAYQPQLRLAGVDDPQVMMQWRQERAAIAAVAAENRAAQLGPLSHADPRWVLAVRAYSQLQGPVLTPERREGVMRTAKALGVRPFDANVIIAIVQDHARCGRALREAGPTIALLPAPGRVNAKRRASMRFITAIITAIAATSLLVWWLTA